MRNPLDVALGWLRGTDLQPAEVAATEVAVGSVQRKLFQWQDPGALIVPPTMVTGPAQWFYADPIVAQTDGNSAVWSCLLALSNAHIEPPLKVWRGDPDSAVGVATAEWLADSALQLLLMDPNPVHTPPEVWFWTSWAKHTDGNAYLRKVRSGDPNTGNVVQLWPISPRLIRPITYKGSPNFIDAYRYSYAPGKYDDIDPRNIVHFRIGIDDQDHRLGLSPIKRLLREIASDQSATQYTDALLRNFGIPGLVVTVPQNSSLNEQQADEIKQRIEQRFGYENRGNVGVLTAGATIAQFGFSPDQLNMKELHEVPETRICAVMGVPPVIAGLSSGLGQSQNYASMKVIRENFTELTVVPLWRMDAAKLNKELRPDFTAETTVRIGYDLSMVRALQEDRNQLFTRLDNAVRTGWVLPNEARAEVGYAPKPWGEVPMPQPAPLVSGGGAGQQTNAGTVPAKGTERVISLKAGELSADALQALVELGTPALHDELERFFQGQRRRVIRSLTGTEG
jgi:HK97 family phage portal protein